MHLVLSWSNVVQCWRPNHRPPTVPRIRPLISLLLAPIPTPTLTRRMALATVTATATVAVVRRLHHAALSGIPPVVGATTAGHHLPHRVPVGTSRVANAMTVARHHHLAPGGMTTERTTGVATMAEIVTAVSRIRGRHLVGATTARVSVRHRHGRACGTAIENAITTEEETTHGTDTGIAGVDGKALIYGLCAQHMSFRSVVRYVFMCASSQKICTSFERIL